MCPTIFDRHVPVFDETGFAKASVKKNDILTRQFGRCEVNKPDHGYRGLLSARRQRPRSCCATCKKCDELAPLQVLPKYAELDVKLRPSKQESTTRETGERCDNVHRRNPERPLSESGLELPFTCGRRMQPLHPSQRPLSQGDRYDRVVPASDSCNASKALPSRQGRACPTHLLLS
jgi:hypothetical protein